MAFASAYLQRLLCGIIGVEPCISQGVQIFQSGSHVPKSILEMTLKPAFNSNNKHDNDDNDYHHYHAGCCD